MTCVVCSGRPVPILKAQRGVSRSQIARARQATRRLEPRVRRAFIRALRALKDQIVVKDLVEALEAGQINRVLGAVNVPALEGLLRGEGVDGESFRDALITAFERGAETAIAGLPKAIRLQASFDLLNPRAVRFLERYRFGLIRQVTNETRQTVQGVILRSFNEGIPPRQAARHIRASIGLTEQQARAVDNFRRSLVEQRVFGAFPSDRRLNAIERAQALRIFRDGGTQQEIRRLTEAYQQRLVNMRALNIARTETIRAHSEGQQELWNQALERDLLDAETTRRMWVVTPDDRLSDHDAAIPGMNEDGVLLNQPFRTPSGPLMNPPTRPNCRCTVVLRFLDEE